MKKQCEQTRQALPRYLHGHLFKTSKTRIERHLRQCVVCRSEYEALRRAEETRQILRDINAPEGVVGRMREGVSAIARLKKIVYRPLWIAGIIVAAAAVYYYVITPRQLELDIENIVKSAPTETAVAPSAEQPGNATSPSTPLTGDQPSSPASPPVAAPLPAPAFLVVTLTPENDHAAVLRINEVMHGHGELRKLTFSDTVKEVSGSLTAGELLTLFDRIGAAAKVSFSRKRLEAFPTAQPVPFVLKLKAAPPVAELPPAEAAAPAPPRTTAAPPAAP